MGLSSGDELTLEFVYDISPYVIVIRKMENMMDEEIKSINRIQVDPSYYQDIKYITKERFCSYWHQIKNVVAKNPDSILDIGIGIGILGYTLRQMGFKVTTLDIDGRLKPSLVATVEKLPFASNHYDLVACYEVLEHLPYILFSASLSEIHRVCKRFAMLSLPDRSKVHRVTIQLPKLGEKKCILPSFLQKSQKHIFDGQHYWEIGKQGYELNKIIRAMQNASFIVEKTYRVYEMPLHRFFLLRKKLDHP